MTVSHAMLKAAIESRASDDHGLWESLGDLLGFSGENMTQIVVRAALEAAMAAKGKDEDLVHAETEIKHLCRLLHNLCNMTSDLSKSPVRVVIENTLCRLDEAYPPDKEDA